MRTGTGRNVRVRGPGRDVRARGPGQAAVRVRCPGLFGETFLAELLLLWRMSSSFVAR